MKFWQQAVDRSKLRAGPLQENHPGAGELGAGSGRSLLRFAGIHCQHRGMLRGLLLHAAQLRLQILQQLLVVAGRLQQVCWL